MSFIVTLNAYVSQIESIEALLEAVAVWRPALLLLSLVQVSTRLVPVQAALTSQVSILVAAMWAKQFLVVATWSLAAAVPPAVGLSDRICLVPATDE